ncbi:MAG: thermonuclease family protein [Rhabdaerophilum sp.]
MMFAFALAITACQPPPAHRFTCVVDGDTVWIEGEKIRLLDIDAPEMEGRCAAERAFALRSRNRLIVLLRGREVVIARDGVDRYGRTLARLGDVGEQLVREGLARRWGDRRGWCG